jgi:hypothetical protein
MGIYSSIPSSGTVKTNRFGIHPDTKADNAYIMSIRNSPPERVKTNLVGCFYD